MKMIRPSFFAGFFESGHRFEEHEILLKYRYRVLNTILLVIAVFPVLFSVASITGVNPLGPVHTVVNLLYAVSGIALLSWLRGPKTRYHSGAYMMYIASLGDFISSLIYVPHDEFRIIWFYLVVFAAYITGGARAGNAVALFSMLLVLSVNATIDLHLSSTAIVSSVVGLLIASILFRSYANKIVDFEEELVAQKRHLQDFNNRLEALVEQKTAELQELNASLEAKVEQKVAKITEQERLMITQSRLAAMGEMMSMIAHQWRQPLSTTTLMITNERLKSMIAGTGPSEHDEILQKISDTMVYLSDTIDDFQTYFKPDKQSEEIRVCDIIERVVNFSEARFKVSGMAMDVECEDRDFAVTTYSSEVVQVLINIINNAVDAMLEHPQPQRRIRLHVSKKDGGAVIVIEDNGGGMAPEVMPKIFEPYFSTKSKNGTGLGLYMAKMIIEKHIGGTIRAENSENGARFTITLPAMALPAELPS